MNVVAIQENNTSLVTVHPSDIRHILDIIDLAARRGSFLVDEFHEIASIYSRFKNMIHDNNNSNNNIKIG